MSDAQSIVNQSGGTNYPVLLFDGMCGLCDRFVRFLFLVDKRKIFRVAPLQGAYAARVLPKLLTEDLKTVVVVTEQGEVLTKSGAVIFILKRVGGVWPLFAYVGQLLPRSFSDFIYSIISRNRYRLFGRYESCRIPTAEESCRFLD
jgi:predicted DCC family thiol-disulfide oxidoreductase YuxK